MKIIIDVQEKNSLMKSFGSKNADGQWVVDESYKDYVEFKSLNCGDILLLNNDIPVVLIERKQVRDLATCLSSKSYKEQKIRMLKYKSENPQVELVYLVEEFILEDKDDLKTIVNPSAPLKHRKNVQTLLSAIVSTMFRDNFKVMITQGLGGTVAFIERIYAKYPSYGIELQNRQDDMNLEYLKTVKTVKKDNITPSNWFILSLQQIPGMSAVKAQCVSEVYSSFGKLLEAYADLETEKEKETLLKDLQLNNRKLGPVLSKRIYNMVCPQ